MKKPSMQVGLGIALGAGTGAAIAVGIVIGLAMSKRKADSSPLEAVRSDERFLS